MINTPSTPQNEQVESPELVAPEKEEQLIAGRYLLVNQFEGGMGLVYLCRDKETTQPVALKTFKPEYLPHRMARDLFLREGTMWVELGHHPHIVDAYRVERNEDGNVYLVLEWVVQPEKRKKPSLRAWLYPDKPLPLKQAMLFTLHIVRGMKYATSKIPGLVHRDLKPENVLIRFDYQAKVTDFGLASTLSAMEVNAIKMAGKGRDDYTRTQLTQGAAGTPLYMSPEQWRREPLDARSDIYSLGCILYEMLVGRFAAAGDSREAIRAVHENGRIQPPPESIPLPIRNFLRSCLATERDQRFAGWQEVEVALEQLFRGVLKIDPPQAADVEEDTRENRVRAGRSYNTMGLSYLDIGKLPVAVMYFEQAVWIGRKEDELSLEGDGLGNLGLAYSALGYHKRAIEFHEEYLAIAKETDDLAAEGRAYGNLGVAYLRLKQRDEAVELQKRQLEIAQQRGDGFTEAAALSNLGDVYLEKHDHETAVSYYQRSLKLAGKIGDRNRTSCIQRSMGQLYLADGNIREAAVLLNKSLATAGEIGDRIGQGESLRQLGHLYRDLNNEKKALRCYEKALTIAQEMDNRRQEAQNLTDIGQLYYQKNESKLAISYYKRALVAYTAINDAEEQVNAMLRLGRANAQVKEYMGAANLYRRALAIARERTSIPGEQQALLNLGIVYELWGDLGRAIEYYEKHLAVSEAAGDDEGRMLILLELGNRYHRIKQLHRAKQTYEAYLELAIAHENQTGIGQVYSRLGDLARDRGKAKEAVQHYKDALALAELHGTKSAQAAILSNLGLAYQESSDIGRTWLAVRYAERAITAAEEARNSKSLAFAHYKLGLLLRKQKKWDKATKHIDESRRLFSAIGNMTMVQRSRRMTERLAEERSASGFLS